jgi:hypothetical protein
MEDHDTWITSLIAGRISDEEQAMRDQFRALQAAKPRPAVKRPAGVETTGPNTWAVTTEDGDDGLTTYTHLAGPGIPGLIAGR